MERRGFLKAAAAALLAPLALVKTVTAKPEPPVDFVLDNVKEPRWEGVERAMSLLRKSFEKNIEATNHANEGLKAFLEECERVYQDYRPNAVFKEEDIDKCIVPDGEFSDMLAHHQWKTVEQMEREELWELGRRAPYHRMVDFPVEVTSEIEIVDQKAADRYVADYMQFVEDTKGFDIQRLPPMACPEFPLDFLKDKDHAKT